MKKISMILTLSLVLTISICMTAFAEGETGSIVSSGHGSTYVIKNDGSLWGWGGSYTGNGNGYKKVQITPAKILDNVKAVSANGFGGVAVKKDDTLWAWGSLEGYPGSDGKVNPDYLYPQKIMDDVKLASMGKSSIAVIKNDDSLWLCGDVYIGDGTNTQANGSNGFVKVMSDVRDVFNGWGTTYVIKNDNTLWGWGENSDGELGNMSLEDSLVPVKILDDVKLIRLHGSTVFAIRTDDSLYSWGHGMNDGIYTENGWVEDAGSPYKVMDDVRTVTACNNGSGVLIVKTDSTLWGWNNQWNDEGNQMTPYKYADNVSYVSNGERHAAVVMKDNTLWTMGGNYRKGLGYESSEVWYTPLTKIVDNVQDAPASWAMEEVEKAIGERLIPEEMQGNYTKSITREEFCILAIRMIEVKSDMSIDEYLNEVGTEIAPMKTFTDCDTKEVRAAKALGITDGTSPTEFSPDNFLTREQAAKFLTTTAMACGRDVTLNTPDYADINKIASWAKPYTGYVYDINVMKGVGANKFDPQGSYQRQQAFMTMYRIWKSIDAVKPSNVEVSSDTSTEVKNPTDKSELTIDDIKSIVKTNSSSTDFTMLIEGTSVDTDFNNVLKYDVYYKDDNVRIDTYWDGKKITKAIYNTIEDKTTTEHMNYTNHAEVIDGNMLPIRLLNIEFVEELEAIDGEGTFTANYEMLNGEKTLYIKTTYTSGVTMEFWYSLRYIAPIKFRQIDLYDDGTTAEINWAVKSISESEVDMDLFTINSNGTMSDGNADDYYGDKEIKGDTRSLLLYEANTIANDEAGLEGMMRQVLYYSDVSYELLVAYFTDLLKGTDDYSLFVQDGRTSIDGTINGESVIVIVNDYMTTEPEVGMNGVNVNYYD